MTKTCGNLGRFSLFCSRIRIFGQPHIAPVLMPAGALVFLYNKDPCNNPVKAYFEKSGKVPEQLQTG